MEWKPRGRRQLVFSLGMIDLLLKEPWNLSGLRFSLVSCSEEFGNSSLNAPALSLHSASNSKPSHLNLTINLPVHPLLTLTLQPQWRFLEEKKHKRRNKAIHLPKTVHSLSASSQRGKKDLLPPPAFPRTQPLEIPLLPACSSTGSSPTLNRVS
ncbi:hypothetical protein CRENBAI_013332 [Crenichthys baileyi]|uniref:Uncharacterized protein n=1 Tax=Crenichthys baileyi TaxID=28760 RepID=A0AAV9R4I2_9TELE